MANNGKIRVMSDGVEGFFKRARDHARKLDRGEKLKAEVTISFEDAADMVRVLSEERVRLLQETKKKPHGLSELAEALHRDKRAVARDVDLLETFGLVTTTMEANPGHGRKRVVRSKAEKYQLVANI